MERDIINIRNIYIELLNKIKNVEGVDKDYVDDLMEVVDLHLNALDQDLSAITNVIPEEATVTNKLVPESEIQDIELDIETISASVSAITLDVSGINAVIPSGATSSNKLVTRDTANNTFYQLITPLNSSNWVVQSGGGYKQSLYCTGRVPDDYIPTIFIKPEDQAVYASDFRKIKSVEFVNNLSVGAFWLHFYADTAPTSTFNIVIQTQQIL